MRRPSGSRAAPIIISGTPGGMPPGRSCFSRLYLSLFLGEGWMRDGANHTPTAVRLQPLLPPLAVRLLGVAGGERCERIGADLLPGLCTTLARVRPLRQSDNHRQERD